LFAFINEAANSWGGANSWFTYPISQSLKLRILNEKVLSISLKLNFTPNTLSCYGLMVVGVVNEV